MKLSILLPTLFPPLAQRLIESYRKGGFDDYEIVVCCPTKIEGDRIVWVEDKWNIGHDPACRQAFLASKGDIVMEIPDDHLLVPNGIATALKNFEEHPHDLWDLNADWYPRIFGQLFAAYWMCSRHLVEIHWKQFFPYLQHFGDPSFSLSVWRMDGVVRQMPVQLVTYPWQDRLGQAESEGKTSRLAYTYGKMRIFEDFPEFSNGWSHDPAIFNA